MEITVRIAFDTEMLQIEEWAKAQALAVARQQDVYTWKTTCLANWLERGISNVDALGLVLVPKGMAPRLEMPFDADEDA
ncbi:MAG: hypothetical protein HY261_01005 [Chloroflexi bacterium]|nr:hypothetical protein [Chloroflexota bacterium]